METMNREGDESCRNDYHQSSERILAEPGSNQRPPVLKSATLSTELWGSAYTLPLTMLEPKKVKLVFCRQCRSRLDYTERAV